MTRPNNLDRCRTKYLMRNIVSCGAWGWCWDPMLTLLWGMLLEDQLELMLRRKSGAQTRGISHRLFLQQLPLLLGAIQLPGREQRQGLAMAATSFTQTLCPDAVLRLLWGMCGGARVCCFWCSLFLQTVLGRSLRPAAAGHRAHRLGTLPSDLQQPFICLSPKGQH